MAGLQTTVGVSIGLAFYATLSLLGLSAVLVQYQWLTWAVRLLGGAYLIYLGIRLLRSKPAATDNDVAQGPVRGNALLFGFLVTLTNPKAIVLFASVMIPSGVSATMPNRTFCRVIVGVCGAYICPASYESPT